MKKKALYVLYLSISTILLLELLLRIFGDREGRHITLVNGYIITAPRTLADWENDLKLYTDPNSAGKFYYKYDSLLGWTVNPNTTSLDSVYTSNNQGIRSNVDLDVVKDSSTLRIAVFGDSFTEGYKVSNEETWPFFTERALLKKGVKAEVLNYGVPGYGIDQAYLRWKTVGYKTQPDIVVLGLNLGNFWRNLNTFRPSYHSKAGILLTKPRAMMFEGSLRWQNIPTIHPKNILDDVVRNFNQSELYQYEYFNGDNLWSESILTNSLFYLFIRDLFIDIHFTDYIECPEGQKLTLQLIANFASETESKGSDFMIIQMLQSSELKRLQNDRGFHHQEMFNQIVAGYKLCSTQDLFLSHSKDLLYDSDSDHPTAFANEIIGKLFANYVIEQMNISHSGERNDDI